MITGRTRQIFKLLGDPKAQQFALRNASDTLEALDPDAISETFAIGIRVRSYQELTINDLTADVKRLT